MGVPTRRFLLRNVRKSRPVRLGVLERLHLGISGSRDGMYSLPRHMNERGWTSAIVQREINACNEALNAVIATVQIQMEGKYAEASALMDKVEHHEYKIKMLEKELPEDLGEEESSRRKHGEESLTESQVIRRRQREHDKEVQRIKCQIEEVKKESEKDYESLVELRGVLTQTNLETEIVCAKILSHTQQRIDYYWNSAVRSSHKLKREVPPICSTIQIPNVLERYRAVHEPEEKKMDEIIQLYKTRKEAA